jgi:prophage DNA circulation protein
MTTWRDSVREASFKGVPFFFDTDDLPIGRRLQTHRYPQRDRPYSEDMGRVAREFNIRAFVGGPDCFEQRDVLLRAVNEEGAGQLVHPYYGTMRVKAGVGSVSHDRRNGGVVDFDLNFIEDDDQEFPAETVNTGQVLEMGAEDYLSASLTQFEQAMALIKTGQIGIESILDSATAVFTTLYETVRPIADAFRSAQNLAYLVMNAPSRIPAQIQAAFGGYVTAFDGFQSSCSDAAGKCSAVQSLDGVPSPQGTQAKAVHAALVDLAQNVILVDVVRDVAAMPIVTPPASPTGAPSVDVQVVAPVAYPEVPTSDDIVGVIDVVTDQLWEQALQAPYEQFEAIADIRRQVENHLQAVARQGVRLQYHGATQVQPALVLSYELYGTAARAAEIVERNKISHPGFLPVTPIQVAAK